MRIALRLPDKLHIKSKTVLLYLIMFFSGDTYLFGTNSSDGMVTLSRYLLIPVCVFLFMRWALKRDKREGNNRKLASYLIIIIAFVLCSVMNHDSTNYIIIKILIITAALLLTLNYTVDEYITSFCESVYFIAVCSVILEIIAYVLPALVYSLPSIVGTGRAVTKSCLLAGVLEDYLGTIAVRASGIFWEPGVFTIYLNLAIAFELFYKAQINKKYLIVEVLAMAFTFSTTGYIVFAWQLLCYGLFGRRETDSRSKNSNRVLFVFVVAVFLSLIVFSTNISDVVFAKFTYIGGGSARKASVIINLQMALAHPIIGIGNDLAMHDEFVYLVARSPYIHGVANDNTNTLLYLFAAYGIPFGMLFTIGTYRFGEWISRGRKRVTIIFFSIIVLLYIGENLKLSTLPFVITFFGYQWSRHQNNLSSQYS